MAEVGGLGLQSPCAVERLDPPDDIVVVQAASRPAYDCAVSLDSQTCVVDADHSELDVDADEVAVVGGREWRVGCRCWRRGWRRGCCRGRRRGRRGRGCGNAGNRDDVECHVVGLGELDRAVFAPVLEAHAGVCPYDPFVVGGSLFYLEFLVLSKGVRSQPAVPDAGGFFLHEGVVPCCGVVIDASGVGCFAEVGVLGLYSPFAVEGLDPPDDVVVVEAACRPAYDCAAGPSRQTCVFDAAHSELHVDAMRVAVVGGRERGVGYG